MENSRRFFILRKEITENRDEELFQGACLEAVSSKYEHSAAIRMNGIRFLKNENKKATSKEVAFSLFNKHTPSEVFGRSRRLFHS